MTWSTITILFVTSLQLWMECCPLDHILHFLLLREQLFKTISTHIVPNPPPHHPTTTHVGAVLGYRNIGAVSSPTRRVAPCQLEHVGDAPASLSADDVRRFLVFLAETDACEKVNPGGRSTLAKSFLLGSA